MVIRHKGYAAEKVSRKFAELPKKTFMRSWIIHCYLCGLKEIVSLGGWEEAMVDLSLIYRQKVWQTLVYSTALSYRARLSL